MDGWREYGWRSDVGGWCWKCTVVGGRRKIASWGEEARGRCWKRGIGCLSTKIVLEVDSLDSCGMVLVVATKGVKGGTVEAAPAIGIATTASCLALGGRCASAAVWGS